MPRSRDGLDQYVVELDVEAIAVVDVRARSPEAATNAAELRVRVADVIDLGEVTGVRVRKVSGSRPLAGATRSAHASESASKGVRRGRQA